MAVSGGAMAAVVAAAATAAAAAACALLRRRMLRQLSGISAAYTATAGPPPHPRWNPGEKQPLPFQTQDFVTLDPKELKSCYPLVISSYVPRPIAFVSTLSASGEGNLAPFSYSGVVAHDPPTIVIGICRGRNADNKKDTLANIDATGEFVVCIMSEWFVEAANHCCSAFERGVDEFDQSGLTRVPATKVKPPRVGESAMHYECVLRHRYEIVNASGAVTSTMVVGEVVMMHAAAAVCDVDGAGKGKPTLDFAKFQPISRLGGDTYGRTLSMFDLPRPDRKVGST